MNNWIIYNKNKYELYLSSNGVIKIEDLLGIGFSEINFKSVKIKNMIALLCGCLWEKNKLSLEETADLFDQVLEQKIYTLKELGEMIGIETSRWSEKLKSQEVASEDKKK